MYLCTGGQRRYNDSIERRHACIACYNTRYDINIVGPLEGAMRVVGSLDSARKKLVGVASDGALVQVRKQDDGYCLRSESQWREHLW